MSVTWPRYLILVEPFIRQEKLYTISLRRNNRQKQIDLFLTCRNLIYDIAHRCAKFGSGITIPRIDVYSLLMFRKQIHLFYEQRIARNFGICHKSN